MKQTFFLMALLLMSTTTYSVNRIDSIIGYVFNTWIENDSLYFSESINIDTIFIYDDNDNLVSKQTCKFTFSSSEGKIWSPIKSEDYQYNENNLCVEHTSMQWKQGYNWNDPYEWVYDYKYEYTYNNEKLHTIIFSGYNQYNKTFQQNTKTIYHYNENNDIIKEEIFRFNHSSHTWASEPTKRIIYTYSEDNLLTEKLHTEYANSTWKNSIKETYQYTEKKQLEIYTYYTWKEVGASKYFFAEYDLVYEYDQVGNLVQKSHYRFDSNGAWNPDQIHTYTYNSSNLITSYVLASKNYSTNIWSNSSKLEYTYDSEGDIYFVTDWDWDEKECDWIGYRKYYYYYNEKYAPTYEIIGYAYYDWYDWKEGDVPPCSILGTGRYEYNSEVTCQAICSKNYKFVKWMDGNTNATRKIQMNGNYILWAFFEKNDANAIENVPVNNDINSKCMINGCLYIIKDNKIFNILGQPTSF